MMRLVAIVMLALLTIAQAAEIQRWRGTYGGPAEASAVVANDAAQWRALFAKLRAENVPPFDEKRHVGIGLFLGERRTGGYGIRIVSAGPRDGRFVIEAEATAPGPGMPVTQAFTQPWLVMLIDRPELPVVVERRF